MRLLITTQVVDRKHSNLGFFHSWIREFARHCEEVHVICLQEGEHHLPSNVYVHSLGKEVGTSPVTRLARFYRYIWKLRNKYDGVFVHMNPEYVVFGGIFWNMWKKRIALWYVHRSVTLWLHIASFLSDVIFTVTPESIRLRSSKIHAVGHGIDTELFTPTAHTISPVLRILSVGRIARSKGLVEILTTLDLLDAKGVPFTFTIVGAPLTPEESTYEDMLKAETAKRPYAAHVHFKGALQSTELPTVFRDADVFVNISTTGGFDKVVLEALASGVPAVSSSVPFRALLEPYGLFISSVQPSAIADAIQTAIGVDVTTVRAEVEKSHSLRTLIPKILSVLESVKV